MTCWASECAPCFSPAQRFEAITGSDLLCPIPTVLSQRTYMYTLKLVSVSLCCCMWDVLDRVWLDVAKHFETAHT